jgi:hypothetical protein
MMAGEMCCLVPTFVQLNTQMRVPSPLVCAPAAGLYIWDCYKLCLHRFILSLRLRRRVLLLRHDSVSCSFPQQHPSECRGHLHIQAIQHEGLERVEQQFVDRSWTGPRHTRLASHIFKIIMPTDIPNTVRRAAANL